MALTKAEMAERLFTDVGLNKREAKEFVDAFFDVVRGALENAASIAAMILTTDVLITDVPEKDKAPAMPPGGGMDY